MFSPVIIIFSPLEDNDLLQNALWWVCLFDWQAFLLSWDGLLAVLGISLLFVSDG